MPFACFTFFLNCVTMRSNCSQDRTNSTVFYQWNLRNEDVLLKIRFFVLSTSQNHSTVSMVIYDDSSQGWSTRILSKKLILKESNFSFSTLDGNGHRPRQTQATLFCTVRVQVGLPFDTRSVYLIFLKDLLQVTLFRSLKFVTEYL